MSLCSIGVPLFVFLFSICLPSTQSLDDISLPCENRFSPEARLGCNLLKEYQPEVRPPKKNGEKIKVDFGMTLIQIMGIDEKAEELTTTLYMEYQWQDDRLRWNKSDYEGVHELRLPYGSIWIPNIILENSKDGDMEAGALKVNAIASSTGLVKWLPPSIYKTSCSIDVTLFPFDWQNCSLVFRSAALDQSQMVFGLAKDYGNQVVVDKNAFVPNGEWDLIQRPVKIYERPHDSQFQQIAFYFIVKRKAQFYVLNMLLPCVVLSVLSCFTFWLPVISAEKISLAISLLLGDTIFAYLFVQRLPSSSFAVPFAVSYLLFSMCLLTLSIVCCVVVCNLHHRRTTTHKMSSWLRMFFLERLGPKMGMLQPNEKWKYSGTKLKDASVTNAKSIKSFQNKTYEEATTEPPSQVLFKRQGKKFGYQSRQFKMTPVGLEKLNKATNVPTSIKTTPRFFRPAIDSTKFIVKHIHKEQHNEMVMDDWAYMAMILDRFFMWIYVLGLIFGTVIYYFTVETYRYPKVDPY